MANPVIALIEVVLNLYWWVVVIAVIVSWLIAFNVINTYNNFVRSLLRALAALTEPVFRPSAGSCRRWAGWTCRPWWCWWRSGSSNIRSAGRPTATDSNDRNRD